MLLKTNLVEALRSLGASRQRSALALLGIVIGIGSVIAMISIARMVSEEALSQLRAMGTDMMVVTRAFSFSEDNAGQSAEIRLSHLSGLRAYTPGIRLAAPVIASNGDLVLGGNSTSSSLVGVTADYFRVMKLKPQYGRLLTPLDRGQPHVVLGPNIFRDLGLSTSPEMIGRQVLIQNRYYRLVGILASGERNQLSSIDPYSTVLVPVDVVAHLKGDDALSSIALRIQPDLKPTDLAARISNYFALRVSGLQVSIRTAEQLLTQMEKQMQLFTILLAAVGSISLVVGGVGVMNVMLVSVTERKKEIGIRRALGARPADIRNQFMIESVILALLGGLIGILLGLGVSALIAQIQNWQVVISPGAIGLGFGVAAAVGIFFGSWPAIQAARLDPIQALRSD